MAEVIAVETIPIAKGTDGVIRVSGTRVTLETVIDAFREGATPEEISEQYPSVPLGDVYEVIGYFLRHSREFEEYFRERSEAGRAVRAENEQRWPGLGIRERLLARPRNK